MKLKLVVASMSVLGLVSCPAFAATTTKHKHHHHKVMKQEVSQMETHPDYKGMVEPACTISHTSMIMDASTQNMGRAWPSPCNPGWFNRIGLSGGINVDMGKWGNRNMGYMGENYQHVSLNDAYLNLTGNVNEYVKAFASIDFQTATDRDYGFGTLAPASGEYSAAYSNNISHNQTAVQLEQAYMTISNFDWTPVYVQFGKQFQDFGRYEIHPITRSMTQVLSETLATSAKIGFIVPMGFHGSLYAFDTPLNKNYSSGGTAVRSSNTDYGANLGFDYPSDTFGFDLGVGYLYDMVGVNDVAYNVRNYNSTGYMNRVGALAAYGDVNSGPFTLGARYTTALQRFNVIDMPSAGVVPSTTGAKPWAAGVQAGYGFDVWGKNQNVFLGYQTSRQAAGFNLPKNRWLAGYGIDMWKNTNFGIEWDHDTAYSAANGGGLSGNLVTIRSSVKFG